MGYVAGTSGADFRSRMKLVSERVRETVRQKIIRYGITLQQSLVMNTPILTGQARANWQAVIGTPGGSFIGVNGPTSNPRDLAHGPPQRVDYAAYSAQARTIIESFQVGQTLYIYSNLPYIEKLNEGSSRQAPAGFVQSAILTARASVRR